MLPKNIDHLEMPIDTTSSIGVGAALAQLGELLGRSLRLGRMQYAKAAASLDPKGVVVTPCPGGGYYSSES